MKPVFSFYTDSDFGRVYQFMLEIPEEAYLPYERIRLQFCLGLHTPFVDSGLEGGFARTCGIWQDEKGIASLLMTEGGTRWGEAFFLFRSPEDQTDDLMQRMFEFAERFASKVSEDRKSNALSVYIPDADEHLTNVAARRGYAKGSGAQRTMIKKYDQKSMTVTLPDGFSIQDARTVSPFYSALAHNHSFRYRQDNDGAERGFASIRTMPDYRPDLDLILFDPEGQPAGLAAFWIGKNSPTAILEPLGTVWWYRRMGLGKALIYEGINRTMALGCTQMMGGDQPFYEALGFKPVAASNAWHWSSAQ